MQIEVDRLGQVVRRHPGVLRQRNQDPRSHHHKHTCQDGLVLERGTDRDRCSHSRIEAPGRCVLASLARICIGLLGRCHVLHNLLGRCDQHTRYWSWCCSLRGHSLSGSSRPRDSTNLFHCTQFRPFRRSSLGSAFLRSVLHDRALGIHTLRIHRSNDREARCSLVTSDCRASGSQTWPLVQTHCLLKALLLAFALLVQVLVLVLGPPCPSLLEAHHTATHTPGPPSKANTCQLLKLLAEVWVLPSAGKLCLPIQQRICIVLGSRFPARCKLDLDTASRFHIAHP